MNKRSLNFRIVVISAIVVLLLIPLFLVQDLISERQGRRYRTVNEISESWARTQTIGGPIVNIPIKENKTNKNGEEYSVTVIRHILPEELNIESKVLPEIRYRGIYEAVVYNTKLKLFGFFKIGDFTEKFEGDTIKGAYLTLNISDTRGINNGMKFLWKDKEVNAIPGLRDNEVFQSGITLPVKISPQGEVCKFEISLDINGSGNLSFIPLGKKTEVMINSNWNNPSFEGAFLPDSRNITEEKFQAKWAINHFNRDYPQEWNGQNYDVMGSNFGVSLLLPIDEYQKTMRTSKYGLMIIILTFLSFFMIEIFNNKALHPIQYVLIGLGLIIFYSLLLSLSEYIPFKYSYIVAAFMIIGLISLYVKSSFESNLLSGIIAGILIIVYGFMYVILQLQDFALLVGSLALFVVLAAVMYVTRKLNWFDVLNKKEK